jgi:predicted nucleic acid-binding protein
MNVYLLDTSALLTLRDDEPGADRVAELLEQAQRDKVRCLGCFITLMEVLYRVWRDEGEAAGRLAYEQTMGLPIVWIHESPELLKRAAELKATHSLSLADAWIAACALEHGAVLIHKDPEFQSVEVEQEMLVAKLKRSKTRKH